MDLVIIESPLKCANGDYKANIEYAKLCVLDSLSRGESPYASHLLLAQEGILDDTKKDEREKGIEAGLAWSIVADKVAVYTDKGVSEGMRRAIKRHRDNGVPVVFRRIGETTVEISHEDEIPTV